MAMMDWNGNGKFDAFDDFMDYKMSQESKENHEKSHSSGSGSIVGAIGSIVGGLVVTSLIFSCTDVDNVPAILLLVVWMIASYAIGFVIKSLR